MDEQTARVLIAAIGVAGTLLGAIVGAGAVWLIERSRRKRGDRLRFSVEKRLAYARLLKTLDQLIDWADAVRRDPEASRPSHIEMGQFNMAYNEVRLLAPDAVTEKLSSVMKALEELIATLDRVSHTPDDLKPESEWSKALAKVRQRVEALTLAASTDLGIDKILSR